LLSGTNFVVNNILIFLSLVLIISGFRADASEISAKVTARSESEVWFGPNTGSVDMLNLFTNPEQWDEARSKVDVFKFVTAHFNRNQCNDKSLKLCSDNNLNNFIKVDAFSKLKQWGINIAIEMPAIGFAPVTDDGPGEEGRPQNISLSKWCTDIRDYQLSYYISKIKKAISSIESNGGTVKFIAIDEPIRRWYSGVFKNIDREVPICAVDSLRDIADDVATYIQEVKTEYPSVEVGLLFLYPEVSVEMLEEFVTELEKKGTTPKFMHLDLQGFRAMKMVEQGKIDVASDLRSIQTILKDRDISFGFFINDLRLNDESISAQSREYTAEDYYNGTMALIREMKPKFDQLAKPVDQLLFQSWVFVMKNGKKIQQIPNNLRESDSYSHTRLLLDGLGVLRNESTSPLTCKNGICDPGETILSCEQDCPSPEDRTGNGQYR